MDVNAKDNKGHTALHLAALRGDKECLVFYDFSGDLSPFLLGEVTLTFLIDKLGDLHVEIHHLEIKHGKLENLPILYCFGQKLNGLVG